MHSAAHAATAGAQHGTSSRKAEANRANAQHSTGPTSEAGKAASSQNATRHSMLASSATLLAKPNEELQKLVASYRASFRPDGAHEDFLVSEIAVADWRTKHMARIEQGVMCYMMTTTHSLIVTQDEADGLESEDPPLLPEAGPDFQTMMMGCAWVNNPKAFELLHRYQTQARRDYYKALKQLELVRTGKAGYLPTEEQPQAQPEAQPQPAAPAPEQQKNQTKPNVTDYQLKWDDPKPFVVYDPTFLDRLAQPVKTKKQREDEFNPTSVVAYPPAPPRDSLLGK